MNLLAVSSSISQTLTGCITAVFFFTMQDGRIPIMCAGAHGKRELVEILFPWTKPIPSMPEWSVDGIIRGMKYLRFEAQVCM
jgi:hypothetical protein